MKTTMWTKWITGLAFCGLLGITALPAQAADEAPAADAVTTASGDLAPIEIKLPKPMFVGTPKNINVRNLERPSTAKRPPFMAPKGTRNLAKGLEVHSSDEEPIIGSLDLITDGENNGADGYYVELGPGVQWVQLDLGEECEINALLMWHYHSMARVYHDVVIQGADDKDFITGVKTIFNNDIDNSAGLGVGKDKSFIESYEGKLIDTKGVKTRYLRFYSNGNTANEMNHYIEIGVFGRPVSEVTQ